MRVKMFMIIAVIALLSFPVLAQLEQEEEFVWFGDEEEFLPGPPEEEFEGLGLTDEQKDQIYELSYKFRRNQVQDKADLKLAEMELHHMIYKDEDRRKIEKQIDKVIQLRMKLMKQKMLHEQDVREVFTPEQRKMMREMKMKHRMGMCMPGSGMHGKQQSVEKKMYKMKKMMPNK